MPREKKGKVKFIAPHEDDCFICRRPLTDPPGWHCKTAHTTEFVFPWDREDWEG